jgi:CCR4-NOT transcription complex subunit 1
MEPSSLSFLTTCNPGRSQAEIRSLAEQHGLETYLHFIRRLIAASQFRLSSNVSRIPFDTSSALTFRLLVQETQRLARDPFLADRFRDAIDKGEGDIFRHFDLTKFCERIGLRPLERLILASSIVPTSTTRRELASQAAQLIRSNFDEAVVSICKTPSFDQEDLTPSSLAKLLGHLLSDPILDAQQRITIIASIGNKISNESMGPIRQNISPTLRCNNLVVLNVAENSRLLSSNY